MQELNKQTGTKRRRFDPRNSAAKEQSFDAILSFFNLFSKVI
jgi:hypothetical protein